MKIANNTVVTLTFTIFDAQGDLLEEPDAPATFLVGGEDGLLPRIEEALIGRETGTIATLQLEPEDAFGEYDAELVRLEPKARFPEPLEIGMQFEGIPGSDDESAAGDDIDLDLPIFTVTDIVGDQVVLDGNHPYAGLALRFKIEVLEVRAATEEEIDQGFADLDDFGDDDEEAPPGTLLH